MCTQRNVQKGKRMSYDVNKDIQDAINEANGIIENGTVNIPSPIKEDVYKDWWDLAVERVKNKSDRVKYK